MKRPGKPSSAAVDSVNDAVHVLLRELYLTRLGKWSAKLDGIHALDLHVLSYAEKHPQHTMGEMREAVDVPQSTLTSMIDRLEEQGLIRRAINPRDKRSFRIMLTAAGRAVQREHHRVDRLIAGRILEALGDARARTQFVQLLARMSRNLQRPKDRGRAMS